MYVRVLVALLIPIAASVGIVSCGGEDSPIEPTPVCSFSITPASLSFTSEGGTGQVAVTAPAGCTWSTTASASWIGITAGNGDGAGTVTYSVPVNPSTDSRSGTLAIAGRTHTVTQQGRAPAVCSYDLSPTSADVGKDGASGTLAVSAPGECAWTAASNTSWLVVTAGSQGTGPGTVSYTVSRNTDIADRSAAIAIADKSFTVRQAGDVALCQYSVAPVAFSPCMPAGSVTATITTQASCPWTAVPNVSWLDVPGGSSGTGSSTISIAFSDNYDAPRDGIVMVRWPTPTAGQNIRIAQAGCTYAVSRSAFAFTSGGGPGTFDVIQQSIPNTCGGATQDRCIWSAVSDVSWITVTSSMPRAGDNPVAFTVAANDSTDARVGRITVRDKIVVINQSGR